MLVAINYHLLSRRLKTPTSYRQATEAPTTSRRPPAAETERLDASHPLR